ncbi:MAG: lipopolysaccharide biosynthesis protein RfbH [Nitrosopumilaceae archaeon]
MKNKYSINKQIEEIIAKILSARMEQKFVPRKSRIKYAGMVFDKEEIYASIDALCSSFYNNWFALGNNTPKFQKKLAFYLGLKRAIFVNSGSSANLISVATLAAKKRIKRGDEVVTLATTFPTTINPLLIYGLCPVMIDVEFPSYTANLDQLEDAITDKTKLIMLPHINGSPNDMERIMEIAQKHNLAVIEDCCDALGSKYNGKIVGTFGNLGTYSFYAAHHISTGEGGAVGGNDEELILTAESIRDWGRVNLKSELLGNRNRKLTFQHVSNELPKDYEERYTYINIGYNLKPIDMQAAVGLIQLEKLDKFTSLRKRNFKFLYENLFDFNDKLILPEELPKADPSWFVFPITVKKNAGFKRGDIVKFLEERKIETRPILAGNIMNHPAYSRISFRKIGKLPVSKEILENSFFIGIYPGLGKEELRYVIECFKKFFTKFR